MAAYLGSKKAGVVWEFLVFVSAALCLLLKDLRVLFHGSKYVQDKCTWKEKSSRHCLVYLLEQVRLFKKKKSYAVLQMLLSVHVPTFNYYSLLITLIIAKVAANYFTCL